MPTATCFGTRYEVFILMYFNVFQLVLFVGFKNKEYKKMHVMNNLK